MVTDDRTRINRYRWTLFWILAMGYVLVYFHRLSPAVVAVDMMRDLQAGGTLTGLLGAAYFYPYAVMQLPAGLLSDSWGSRKTITFFFGIAFLGSIVLGMAPSPFWAILGRTLVGLGVAMLFVPTMKVLAEWFNAKEFAHMVGILMAMGGIGSLIAASPLVFLSTHIGWRLSFVLVGVFTLILAILVWFIVRDRPEDFGWPSPAKQSDPHPRPISLVESMGRVITFPHFWPLAAWFFFDCAIFFSFIGLWGGPYLMHIYNMGRVQAGQILSMMAIGMIIGSPLLSYLSASVFQARKPVIIFCSIIMLGITAVLAFFTGQIPVLGLYLICLGFGIFASAVVVIGFTMNKELFPVQMAGTATGLVNLFPFAGGAVFQPVLGYLLERQGLVGDAFTLSGYRQAFLTLFGCAVILVVASFFLKETLIKK